MARGDIDAVVALLTEDATLTMPPRPSWFSGLEAVAWFLRAYPFNGTTRWRLDPAGFNGQVASRHFAGDALHGVNVLTLRGDRIADITAFLDMR